MNIYIQCCIVWSQCCECLRNFSCFYSNFQRCESGTIYSGFGSSSDFLQVRCSCVFRVCSVCGRSLVCSQSYVLFLTVPSVLMVITVCLTSAVTFLICSSPEGRTTYLPSTMEKQTVSVTQRWQTCPTVEQTKMCILL